MTTEHVPTRRAPLDRARAAGAARRRETGAGRDQLFGAWRTFFERIAERAPVVLVFEDLHWADRGTARLHRPPARVERAILPIYIVTLARPGAARATTRLGRRQRNFTRPYLEPLPTDGCASSCRAWSRPAGAAPSDHRRPRRGHPAVRRRDRADARRRGTPRQRGRRHAPPATSRRSPSPRR